MFYKIKYRFTNRNYSIEDLEKKDLLTNQANDDFEKKKRRTQITIIDDEKTVIHTNLKAQGYIVQYKKDIKSLEEITSKTDIVIVDVMGVGHKFSESSEGAYLAHSIKDSRENILVYAFTGSSNDARYNKYYEKLDGLYAKNQTEELIEQINEYVKKKNINSLNWKKNRKKLYMHGITTKDICYLEHYYVKAIFKNNQSIFNKAYKCINLKNSYIINSDAINLIFSSLLKGILK